MSEFTDKPDEIVKVIDKPKFEKHIEKVVIKIEPIVKNVCICSGSRHFQCPLHK